VSENSGTNGNFIYYLRYMLCMFTPTLYAFSQPLYHVCADFAQHIRLKITEVNSPVAVSGDTSFPALPEMSGRYHQSVTDGHNAQKGCPAAAAAT
jgi:hypothetical protein